MNIEPTLEIFLKMPPIQLTLAQIVGIWILNLGESKYTVLANSLILPRSICSLQAYE